MTEIFAHNVVVTQDPEAEEVYVVQGTGWDGTPFGLYLNEEEAKGLLMQLGFLVFERST